MSEAAPSEAAPPRRPAAELRGLGVSPGAAAGPAEVMGPAPELPPPRAVTDAEAETGRAVRALAAVEAELDRRAAAAPAPEAREILAAQSAMAADPMLAAGVRSRVERGADAAHALHGAFAEAAQALLAAGGHFADVAGVGLFRTEFLFLGRREEPGPDEQAAAYAEVFAAAGDRTVVVRTLDAGADKPLPFLRMPDEPNPALGVRGLRVARRRPDVLTTQLEAIAAAAAETRARVAVMAPMVSTPAEADEFVALARDRGLPVAGVMIEVPSAALRAARILREAEFLSIGTNDLSQYTLAADRQSSDVPELLDPWQPAVLDLVARCAEAGGAAGKSVGVCGEAAADPLLAPVLAGLGVTRLSMAPRALPAVRAALLRRTFGECADLAERVLAADGPAEARGLALAHHNGGG
ncbi:putative PEP-binding protein [Actinomadura livida]|uniref:Phosphotransferase system enzyme I (PtsI) n=1 Tax=Actinomadura livida TaxID=79909 RepID=A0A7W7IDD9_9ACTN|nr:MULTISPECIES: putative PEP-binding protein [Actinomadura]MBB4775047.1 phosphotransferase system enzyme I (PtsI) [Actinomadura catellatispora]GGT87439.1 hypothetical protein GCM10010208_07580 [Actinomadura livida]